MHTVLTTCPFCSCGCAFYLQTNDGTLIGTAASENHPVARGRLCARGWQAHEAPSWGRRLTRPLVRAGGALEEASWEDAIEAARVRLLAVLERGGEVGVLGSERATNEESYLAVKLARGALATGHLDTPLGSTFRALLGGVARVAPGGVPVPTIEELEAAEVILLLEGDLARTHPGIASAVLRAVRAGARLVTFGAVRTQMSRLAAVHFPVAPGAEAAALGPVIACLLAEGSAEPSAAARCDDLEALRLSLPPAPGGGSVADVARWVAEARRAVTVLVPAGAPDDTASAAAAFASLAALAGHLDRPGSGLLLLPARSNLKGALDMGVAPVGGPGLSAEAMMVSLRGLIAVASDPLAMQRGGDGGSQARGTLECLIVLDAFDSASARAADVVLPIACSAETEGTQTSAEGRVQLVRPAAPPPGEARPGWEVLGRLLEAFGVGVRPRSPAEVRAEIARVIPEYSGVTEAQLADGWGSFTTVRHETGRFRLQPIGTPPARPAERPHLLAWDGPFDWGGDPMVAFSPTLCRDSVSWRKLFPHGQVLMNKADADALGVRQGWPVRLVSEHGEATVPVGLSEGIERGVLIAPVACRDELGAVMSGLGATTVRVERP